MYNICLFRQTSICWIFLNFVFRHSAQCILGYRCGQFGQRTGTNQGTLQSSFTYVFVFSHHHLLLLMSFLISLCRMNRRKRRLPVRSLPCRKPRRWLKSAHCLLPTSPLQREFSVSINVSFSFFFQSILEHFHTRQECFLYTVSTHL